jgi:hypothetical protein
LTLAATFNTHAQTLTFIAGPSGVIVDQTISTGTPHGGVLNFISADLKGDGRRDLLLGIGSYPPLGKQTLPMRVLRPNAAGTGLVDVTRQLFGNGALPSSQHPREFAIADFNRDGKPDIFVAAHGYDADPFDGERNLLVMSNGDGTYTDRSSLLPSAPDFSHCVAVGDVNGDGFLDIYVGNVYGSDRVSPYFLMGRADGGFDQVTATLPASLLDTTGNDRYHVALLTDLDGDGFPDLVLGTTGYAAPDSIVLFNDGKGDFTKRARVTLPRGAFGGVATTDDILDMDVNGDGKMDLIVLSTQSGALQDQGAAVQVLINQGKGVFTDESTARLGASASRTDGNWWTFLRPADIDGDGLMDFYAAGYGGNGGGVAMIWLNRGNGTFQSFNRGALFPNETSPLEVVDVDGDGRLDFATAFVNGDGNLQYRTWLNRTPYFLSRRGSIDLDGKGKSALVVRAGSNDQMQSGRLVNNVFQWSKLTDPGTDFRVLGAFDMAGNGISDLAMLNTNQGDRGDAIVWKDFANAGPTTLRQVRTLWRVDAAGDLDGDGYGDLVWRFTGNSGNIDDTGVSYIWFSDGAGITQVRKRGGAPLDWTLLGARDLNADGAADMIYVSPAGAVRALMATPNRTCANLSAGNLPAGFSALRLGDFTGNTRGDILARNATSGEVRILSLDAFGLTLPAYTGAPDDPNASCTGSSLVVTQKSTTLPLNAAAGWTYYASGDFDGNGIHDVVWKRPDNTLTVWLMQRNGAAPQVIDNAGAAPAGYSPIALQ